MTDSRKILIVEDDPDIASVLSRGLEREGYEVLTADDPGKAHALLQDHAIGAAIIDMMLGEESGADLIRQMRGHGIACPIIVLSALSAVDDRADGLDAGADDYVVKPFAFSELLARLKVQERMYQEQQPDLHFGGLCYDPEARIASGGGCSISLTEKEGRLLEVFLSNPRHVLGRKELFEMLWASDGGTSENVVDVYVGYLRRKLRPIADTHARIITIRGKGFMLTEAADDEG